MRTKRAFFAALFSPLVWAWPIHANSPGDGGILKTSDEGIVIDAGIAGLYTLEIPRLMMKPDDYNPPKPTIRVIDASRIEARYPNGLEMKATITGSRIQYEFGQAPTEAFAFRTSMLIPIRFSQGGKFAFGEDAWTAFPASKDKHAIYQGNNLPLRLLDATGGGLTITPPPSFQELFDNRVFNWPVFCYIFTYEFQAHPGATSFVVEVGLPPAQAAAQPKIVVDRFGQLAAVDFPEKVRSEDDLKSDVAKEAAYFDGLQEEKRDSYGGLLGSREKFGLKAGGFFQVGRAGDRQTLVTPEGNVFFQLGLCCIIPDEGMTVVRGREKIFEWLPPTDGEFAPAWFKEDPTGIVSFHVVNAIRKYGAPFDSEQWSDRVVSRVRKWGFNSAGAFSDLTKTMKARHFAGTPQLPLEAWMAPGMKPMQGVTRTYDPFDPEIEDVIDRAFAEQVAPHASDPAIIGYFVENEVLYENIPKLVPGQKSDSPSKRRLVQLLEERHQGDIEKFNQAWLPQAPFKTFKELEDAVLFATTPQAAADMQAFMELFLETHYSRVARLFRKHDPNHLLLGSRWQPRTADEETLVRIAARYMDVISVNYYVEEIDPAFLERVHRWSGGKPLLLSEWHFTASDQGLGGLRQVANQKERGLAYRNYVETAATLPFVVGQQWFGYADQAVTGRWFEGFNGEAANTGLVNVADRPYLDFVTEVKTTNDAIYKVMFGEQKPFRRDGAGSTTESRNIQKSLSVPRALAGMQVDGTTQKWPGRPAELLTPKNQTQGEADPEFSASFRLCWDEQNLFVTVETKDKSPLANSHTGADLARGDSVVLSIGSNVKAGPGAPVSADSRIILGASIPPSVFVATGTAGTKGVKTTALRNAAGDGYTIQAALPWSMLGIKPEPGTEFLLDLEINASDGPSKARQWIWSGRNADSPDRGSWAKARLTDN